MSEEDYKKMREPYIPTRVEVIFVLESPPRSGKYFYNPDGTVTEPLFMAMMTCVLGYDKDAVPVKSEGLREFAAQGYLLVDATYSPVNKLKKKKRDEVIRKNSSRLMNELRKFSRSKNTRIILVKANVCRILEPLLKKQFNVANEGVVIPFPAYGHQKDFCRKIKKLL